MSSLGIGLTPAVPKSRDDIEATAQGFLGEAFSRKQIQSNQILASQQLEAIAVGLRGGTVISNLYVSVNVNGATLTLTKGGIYDKSGNRLAASADVSSSFTAGTTPRVQAIPVSYTVPTDDLYYLVFLAVGTTAPSLSFAGQVNAMTAQSPSGPRAVAQVASQTDLAASVAFTTVTVQRAYWFAWS
jgi:hypothetical protein